jgi:hypothetical protein
VKCSECGASPALETLPSEAGLLCEDCARALERGIYAELVRRYDPDDEMAAEFAEATLRHIVMQTAAEAARTN